MKFIRLSPFIMAAALAACEGTSPISSLVSDSTVTSDVAISAGDAIATALTNMALNEGALALPGADANENNTPFGADNDLSFNRVRTCFDANNAVVQGCSPLSSVRKVVTLVNINGSRSGSRSTEGGRTVTWYGAVHRTSNDTVTRNFNGSTEVSRTHSDLTVGRDTLTFTDGEVSRLIAESANDSIKAVTWNIPRSSNPFPISGSVVRFVSVHVVATSGNETRTRDVTRKVSVVFPADSQGNVVLTINDKTCNLNLVTHAVSNCQ